MALSPEDDSPGCVAAALHFATGAGLVFVCHLLIGTALLGGAWAGDSAILAGAWAIWVGCLGGVQLVYVVPLFAVAWAIKRPLAMGIAAGAALGVLLQVALYLLAFVGAFAALRAAVPPPSGLSGDFDVSYDGPLIVRAGGAMLLPEYDASGFLTDDPLRRYGAQSLPESALCGPEGVSCPGPSSWDRLRVEGGDELFFTFEGQGLEPGGGLAQGTLDDNSSITLQLDQPPDGCEGGTIEIRATPASEGDLWLGEVTHYWPAGCTVSGVRFAEELELSRTFEAHRVWGGSP